MKKLILGNRQELYGLSTEERDKIKDVLTFDNPAYKNARRFSKSRYISIPPYLMYYKEFSYSEGGVRKKVLSVPIGFDVTKYVDIDEFQDNRRTVNVTYPKFSLDLREDQVKAESAYVAYHSTDLVNEPSIIQLPTGKGKSILALHIAHMLGQKTLILVHKDDLVVGWQKDIQLCFPGIECGLIKAKRRKVGKQITIATVQTLSRMSEEELSSLVDQFGFVVQDEVHHVGLNIFNVIDKFNSRFKLGLSATPKRTDGLNFVFDVFFGGVCYRHEVTKDDADISQVEVRLLESPFKYRPFSVQGQCFNYYDFEEDELPDEIEFVEEMPYELRPRIPYLTIDDEAVTSDDTGLLVCDKIEEEYNMGHSVLVLFTQKEHINSYYRYLSTKIPKDKIMLYYGDSKEKSSDMMRKAEDKEVLITLATYAKATEGTNVRSWEVLFLVSSLNNEKNVEQATGRIRRKKEGKINPVIVYDVSYPDCYSLRSHYATRKRVYKRLKYIIQDNKKSSGNKKSSLFSRGYH